MSVILFREGQSKKFDDYTFVDRLEEGWSLTDGDVEVPPPVVDIAPEKAEVALKEESNIGLPKNTTNPGYGIGSGPDAAEWIDHDKKTPAPKKLSNKKIRAMAKEAKIPNHKKARIATLKAALKI